MKAKIIILSGLLLAGAVSLHKYVRHQQYNKSIKKFKKDTSSEVDNYYPYDIDRSLLNTTESILAYYKSTCDKAFLNSLNEVNNLISISNYDISLLTSIFNKLRANIESYTDSFIKISKELCYLIEYYSLDKDVLILKLTNKFDDLQDTQLSYLSVIQRLYTLWFTDGKLSKDDVRELDEFIQSFLHM